MGSSPTTCWAFAQNADKNSPFYQKIDTKNICISGMSCGDSPAILQRKDWTIEKNAKVK